MHQQTVAATPGGELLLAEEPRIWIAVRRDLAMSPGKLVAQAGHAAFALGREFAQLVGTDPVMARYHRGAQTKITVAVDGEAELRAVFEAALVAAIPAHLVVDAGRSELAPGTPTVCAFGPALRSSLPAPLRRLRLL